MNRSIYNKAQIQAVLAGEKPNHSINILLGEALRKRFQYPLKRFPTIPKIRIMVALIATCSTEEEIDEVLLSAGFGPGNVSVSKDPETPEERQAISMCQLVGTGLTKEGRPCMTLGYYEELSN